ncbi:MAG: hypothetical protein R3F13_11585 [Prosthecobacter sp.]
MSWVLISSFYTLSGLWVHAGGSQTIAFSEIPSKQTSDGPFALSATASSGLAVTFSIESAVGVATLSDGTITLTGAVGSVTVKASQAGDGTYDPAPDVFRSFSVQQGVFVILAQGPSAIHRLGIKSDGTLWAWGSNSAGQIGNGGSADVFAPEQITAMTGWTAVAVGGEFSAGVQNGTLWTWGRNSSGQLGLGNFTNQNVPTQVGVITTWTHVAAGNTFMIARRSDGTLWAWGSNTNGQLGQGDFTTRSSPTQIGTGTSWASVATGSDHVIAVQNNGTLWAWGLNSSSQLGDSSTISRNSPVQIGTITTWSRVACGGTSSYSIRSDGTLWSWGSNTIGQLGLGNSSPTSSPTQVGALATWSGIGGGNIHAIALQTDGSLWAWGATGNAGATATGSSLNFNTPQRIGTENDWTTAAAGTTCCFAVKSNGTVWSAGLHANGRLGYPLNNLRPIATGGIRALAQGLNTTHFIKNDGTLWVMGRPSGGLFGNGSTSTATLPVQVGTATNWQDIAVGNSHSLALRTDGTLWAAGAGSSGQIGDGAATTRLSFVQVGSSQWKSIGAGGSHSLAVRNDGTLWAWGLNLSGQIGDGTITQRNSPVQIGTDSDWAFAACGSSSSFAIKTTGTLWAWGSNTSGQLGDGSATQRNSPVQVGTASNWKKVTSGLSHTHAVQTDGTLWAWGANSFGNLGDGTFTQRTSPIQIGTSTDWTLVQSLSQHTIALRSDGTAWVCGLNSSSQLGTGDSSNRNSFVQLGNHNTWSLIDNGRGLFTIAVTADGTLWGTGNNCDYQISSMQRVWSLLEPVHPAISPQSVVFPPVIINTYGAPIALAASSDSGLPVSYHVSGPASVSDSLLTVTGPGEVKVMAYQAGERPVWHDTAVVQAVVSAVPYIESNSITNVTMSDAALDASVSGAGQMTNCVLEYDTNIADGSYAFSVSGSPGTFAGYASTPVTASITALQGGTTYYFKLTASNATGSSSVTGSFMTLPTAFQQWTTSHGLSGNNAAPDADGDGDGLSNLLEWACNLSPSAPSILSSSVDLLSGSIEYTYSRSVAAVNSGAGFAVEWSDTLDAGSWSTTGVSQNVLTDDGNMQQVKAVIPYGGGTRRFVHLKVTSP